MNAQLFAGQPNPRTGLSNEDDLARLCPPQFLEKGNPWANYAGNAAIFPANKNAWKWKSRDPQEQKHQLECFESVLDGPHHDHLKMTVRSGIAGWMLSEMLEELPSR